jgi:sigma-B regulation protein RsbU (phosphoserine phosphatase)
VQGLPGQAKRYGDGDRPTILLAEDSSSTRGLIRSWLVKAGYTVWEAKDGQEAWNRFLEAGDREIALVLTDIEMPVMDGLELVARIRGVAPDVPIAILSSVEDAQAHKQALRLHVNHFLEKPFSSEALLDRVRQLVEDFGAKDKVRKSTETVQSVRQAHRAMVAVPEMDLPIFTLSEPLSDAGGDVFRCFRQANGSILFVLADVVGHSVLSSYAVASFLGMLSTFLSDEGGLRQLAVRLNKAVQSGPFAEIPICAVFGQWDPALGRLHVLNAGIPYGLHLSPTLKAVSEIQVNGTPLGMFPDLDVEEKVLWLRAGDRLVFGTDGVFEAGSPEGNCFEGIASETWAGLEQIPIEEALGYFCVASLGFANGKQADDVLAIAFEQGPIQDDCSLHLHVPSTAHAVDGVCLRVNLLLSEIAEVREVSKETSFNLLLALREALTNAVYHGNQGRSGAEVFLRCEQSAGGSYLCITVNDEGKGFPFEDHEAPTDVLSERGRGLPLIKSFADSVSMTAGELYMRFEVGPLATHRLPGSQEELT